MPQKTRENMTHDTQQYTIMCPNNFNICDGNASTLYQNFIQDKPDKKNFK